jgi:diaminohydroxyphosphoribosylaminopyrimidine deaminase/5-amino-6-(5-phosphoribosylamino)uracil reductase
MGTHDSFMAMALDEAKKGRGWVNPNPLVGAIIVKNGRIIGRGYHKKFGDWHAERNALASCTGKPEGATMYVTLEPCCHYGKTPPCTDAIIESGIKTVVIGASDTNPLVAGKGKQALERSGIRVISGVMAEACQKQNEVFFHFITEQTPFVVLKYAMTLDGKMATVSGQSKWITGEAARAHVHLMRHQYAGIMVGIGTVIADDPLLTCRLPDCRNPVRIICDTQLRIPMQSRIVETAGDVRTIIATSACECDKAERLREKGVEIIHVSVQDRHVDLRELMQTLGGRKIDSILLEGGAALNASALQSGIVHKIQAYIAPKILGGEGAKSPIGGIGIDRPDEATCLREGQITALGDDLLLEYMVK